MPGPGCPLNPTLWGRHCCGGDTSPGTAVSPVGDVKLPRDRVGLWHPCSEAPPTPITCCFLVLGCAPSPREPQIRDHPHGVGGRGVPRVSPLPPRTQTLSLSRGVPPPPAP